MPDYVRVRKSVADSCSPFSQKNVPLFKGLLNLKLLRFNRPRELHEMPGLITFNLYNSTLGSSENITDTTVCFLVRTAGRICNKMFEFVSLLHEDGELSVLVVCNLYRNRLKGFLSSRLILALSSPYKRGLMADDE